MPRDLVVVGGSRGGLSAARVLLSGLPHDLAAAVVVVLHVDPGVDPEGFAEALGSGCALPTAAAEDKDPLLTGSVLVATPGYHLLVEPGRVVLSTDPPVHHSRPSLDVCFESAAEAYTERVVGVVLSGMGRDGAAGLLAIAHRGGHAIVQDPASAEAAEMPGFALAAVPSAEVVALQEIAGRIAAACEGAACEGASGRSDERPLIVERNEELP